jgi:hypothetical protein
MLPLLLRAYNLQYPNIFLNIKLYVLFILSANTNVAPLSNIPYLVITDLTILFKVVFSACEGVPGINKFDNEKPSGTNKYDLVAITYEYCLFLFLS